LTLPEFVHKWQRAQLSERAAAQQHFIDLCDVLGEARPADADLTGETYTFEKGLTRAGGEHGFADVWKKDHFAWEYKGKHKDLRAAYQQLLQYRDDPQNPPLNIVCDLERFEVHTAFNNVAKKSYAFRLQDLLTHAPIPGCDLPPLEVLRCVFTNPDRLRPDRTSRGVTEEVAQAGN
jgi:hypothetical protein